MYTGLVLQIIKVPQLPDPSICIEEAARDRGRMSLWLVSVPNEGTRSSETTFLELKAETASARHDYAGPVCRAAVREEELAAL